MYRRVHSGSCAPATSKCSSLATVFFRLPRLSDLALPACAGHHASRTVSANAHSAEPALPRRSSSR